MSRPLVIHKSYELYPNAGVACQRQPFNHPHCSCPNWAQVTCKRCLKLAHPNERATKS